MRSNLDGGLHAQLLRSDLNQCDNSPANMDLYTKELGIRVKRVDLGKGIEGACKSKGLKKLVVLSPKIYSIEKERFTFFHEIGHLIMHHGNNVCRESFFNLWNSKNIKEKEANDFAVELLLPKRKMMEIIKNQELSFSLIEKVASKYKASISATSIRLVKLYDDNILIIWHDGNNVEWFIKSSYCEIDEVDSNTLVGLNFHELNKEKRFINSNVGIDSLGFNEDDDIVCNEESCYFSNLKKYITILKFYTE